eukprot:ctg_165.g67
MSRIAWHHWGWMPLPHRFAAAAAEPLAGKSACRPRSAASASHLCRCVAVAMTYFGKRLRHPRGAPTPPAILRGGDGANRIPSRPSLPLPLAAESADIRPLFHHRPLVTLAAARHSIPNMPRSRTCPHSHPYPFLRPASPRRDPSSVRCFDPTESPSPHRHRARSDSTFAAGVRVSFGPSSGALTESWSGASGVPLDSFVSSSCSEPPRCRNRPVPQQNGRGEAIFRRRGDARAKAAQVQAHHRPGGARGGPGAHKDAAGGAAAEERDSKVGARRPAQVDAHSGARPAECADAAEQYAVERGDDRGGARHRQVDAADESAGELAAHQRHPAGVRAGERNPGHEAGGAGRCDGECGGGRRRDRGDRRGGESSAGRAGAGECQPPG